MEIYETIFIKDLNYDLLLKMKSLGYKNNKADSSIELFKIFFPNLWTLNTFPQIFL